MKLALIIVGVLALATPESRDVVVDRGVGIVERARSEFQQYIADQADEPVEKVLESRG